METNVTSVLPPRRDWATEYAELSASEGDLGPEDFERGAVAAHVLGEDEQAVNPQTVVWCTGYRSDYSWIDLPVTDDHGQLIADRGVSPEAGLYSLGLEFQYAVASATIQGLDQDARYLMRAMAKQPKTHPVAAPERAAA
jgi:hypothetical protein